MDVAWSIAQGQHGIATRSQLLEAGLSRHAIDRLIRAGLLRALHAGVYQVGPIAAPRAREMAAVLACPGAVVSDSSAPPLWQMLPHEAEGSPVHVTLCAGSTGHRRPGICAHRRVLPANEIASVDGIPVTSPARTLIDLSAHAGAIELERALAYALREGLVRRRQLLQLVQRYRGRAGVRRLVGLLEQDAEPRLVRSEAEARVLGLLRAAGLQDPEMNVVVNGYELDFFWRSLRLAVEVDGYAYHISMRSFVRDRQREAALAAAGIQLIRLSWHQIERERERTLVQLAQALLHAQLARRAGA